MLIVRISQALRKHLKEASTLTDVLETVTFTVNDKYFINHKKHHRTANNSTPTSYKYKDTEYKMHNY